MYKVGDIIRPAIVGRGIRSYVVLGIAGKELTVRLWNVSRYAPYGDEIILDLTSKRRWTLEGHVRGYFCPDNRESNRTQWTHRDWNHHP